MEHYSTESYALTDSIGFAINKARNVLSAEMATALKDLNISSQQMGILMSMRRGLAATPFELARLLGIGTGLMTRMLDKLESNGLLKRSRSLEDRRVVNLELTVKGNEIAAHLPDIVPVVMNSRLQKFSKMEVEELSRLLRKFLAD